MGRNWTEEEDTILKNFVATHGKQWNVVAAQLPRRTPTQIAARWEKCLDPTLTKGPFTAEEDAQIFKFVKKHGPHSWPRINKYIPQRSPKQCRERWFNHLDPNVTKTAWTPEEDQIIFDQYLQMGGKWSIIARLIPGRTDNAVKNRWNSSLSKRLKKDGKGNTMLLPDKSKHHRGGKPSAIRVEQKPERPRPPPLETPPVNDETFIEIEKPTIILDDMTPPSAAQLPFSPFFEHTYPDLSCQAMSPISPNKGLMVFSPDIMVPTNDIGAKSFLFSPLGDQVVDYDSRFD